MSSEEPFVVYIVIFFIAFVGFSLSMWGLGRQVAKENQGVVSIEEQGNKNLAVIFATLSGIGMIMVWVFKYGTSVGIWDAESMQASLFGQGSI